MRHFSLLVPVSLAAFSLVGCGQMAGTSSSTSNGGIAVVDLDKVAAKTHRDRQLAQNLELAQNSLNQALTKEVESAKVQLDAKKKAYGEEMSADDQKEFSSLERSAVTQLSQLQNTARLKFDQFKQMEIAKFRKEMAPIAKEVAAKRGLSVVIPKNEGLLLSVDAGADITDEVIKLLLEKHPVTPESEIQSDAEAPVTKTTKRSSKAQTADKSDASDEAIR